jgi:hypothetical protein
MVDFNRPDILFISMENKTALVINIGVSLTHNLSNTSGKENYKV